MEFEKYSFSFFMRNKEKPFVYEINKEEKERFNKICNIQITEGFADHFFCFETTNGLQVAISLQHLQFAYNLFDPDYDKIFSKLYSENNGGGSISISLLNKKSNIKSIYPLHENVHIQINNRKEILKCGIDEPTEAYNIIDFIDNYPEHDEGFLSFIDIDGEDVLVNPDDIMVLELPSELYNEGYKEIFPESAT